MKFSKETLLKDILASEEAVEVVKKHVGDEFLSHPMLEMGMSYPFATCAMMSGIIAPEDVEAIDEDLQKL